MPDMPMAAGAMSPTPSSGPSSPASFPPQSTGPTPATTAVPNRGSEQMALLAIGMHAQQIQTLLNQLPFGSDSAAAISEALNKIRKHVPPPGSVPSGVEKAQLDAMRAAHAQNAMRMGLQRQQQAGGGAPPMLPRPPMQAMQPSMGM